MAIDPLRSTGGRIIPLHDRGTTARRADGAAGTPTPASGRTAAAEEVAAEEATTPQILNVRKALVLARIQKDYYSQAHVRERVVDSLLQFLDEE